MSDKTETTTNVTTRKGAGCSLTLTVLFFLAKIFGFIDWAWVWVFAPLWIAALSIILLLVVSFILYLVVD